MRGAGGTSGGIGQFFIGLFMLVAGGYLLLNSIVVRSSFGFGYRLYSYGGYGVTSGMVMFPFIIGIAMVFYNSRNPFGWILSLGSVAALVAGVISSIRFSMVGMSAFDLIMILVLGFGGLGLFLRSLRDIDRRITLDDQPDKKQVN
ncbi:Uncharacterised protein [BD1-7 clade bacterium]|uniref:Uncharacterized protein n=1 Tax=BD1-7 clade bacterium TaxID=2029982 RepID=A0A5S9NM80_9GAMM|nr:Uncharacterised protein [BD1-7 clade bacterium]CAA0093986.1 Uncharacterised protein [BD1-7 clade bacterium]